MAEKTMVDKAGEAVGFGVAMAEDVAGAVKTAVGAAVATVAGVLKKAPAKKAPVKQASDITPGRDAAKKAPAIRPIKKPATETAGKESTAKNVVQTIAAKKTPTKKAAKKAVKGTAKKAPRWQK